MEIWALIPIAAIVMWGVQGVARAIAAGVAQRGSRPDAVADDRLRMEVEELRRRVLELEERQDFAERMLTRGAPDGAKGGRDAS